MKAIIVGNGLAGTMAAKTLRELDGAVDIEVFAEEKHHYYPRPNLLEFLAGTLPLERVFAFPSGWAELQRIKIRTGQPVKLVDPVGRTVETEDGKKSGFDVLLLANGSRSFVPPLKGIEKKGVFTLKTLDDAQAIIDYLKDHPLVCIVGGGLLGLEIARAVRTRGAEVEVVEVLDRLLPRQLDPPAAGILKAQVEKMGIKVRLGATTEEIIGGPEARGVRFKGGGATAADMVILAAGVKPDISLASKAGLSVERGVIVDDLLRTSNSRIFAAGDSAQHRGRVYGIIPAAFDQARTVAMNMLDRDKKYEGTVASNTLKVAGLAVTSVGDVHLEGEGYEVLVDERAEEGVYKKVVLHKDRLVGAIWLGTRKGAADIARLTMLRSHVANIKDQILKDDFNFAGR
jgi:nitrite reductase (NADH) large subunit